MGWLWHSNGDSTAKREAEINGSPAQTSQPQPDSQQEPSSQHENPYLKEGTTTGPESNPPMRMGPDENPETNPQRLRHANERFKDEGCCSDLKDARFWEICCMSNALSAGAP